MPGMTIRQFQRERFFALLEQYREAAKDISTPEKKHRFVVLSIGLHAAKASVPKSLWRLVKRKEGADEKAC